MACSKICHATICKCLFSQTKFLRQSGNPKANHHWETKTFFGPLFHVHHNMNFHYLYRLLIDKAQGMPGYVRHMLTDLLTTHQLQIVSLLQYQTEFDDFTWPEFERITGHPTVIERKRSMLHSKNKWAFHTSVSGLSVYNTVKWFGILVIINE